MKIITILGDSLSMARMENGIFFENTYAFLLQDLFDKNYLVVNKSKRANTIVTQSNTQNMYDDVLTIKNSDTFIIQLGIVDCAPRIISIWESKILKYFRPKFISNYYMKFKSKNRKFFTKYYPKTYVPLEVFKKRYNCLIETISNKTPANKIILINIADTNDKNKSKSFGFSENINKYNEVIASFVGNSKVKISLIDLYSITKKTPEFLLEDGIHINKDVHSFLSKVIYEKLTE